MEFNIIPDSEALKKCAACGRPIADDMEVFALGVKTKPEVDLSDYRSHCIEIDLCSESRPVCMLVTAKDSEARKQGQDGLFLLCSEACGKQFRTTLQNEIAVGTFFESAQSG